MSDGYHILIYEGSKESAKYLEEMLPHITYCGEITHMGEPDRTGECQVMYQAGYFDEAELSTVTDESEDQS